LRKTLLALSIIAVTPALILAQSGVKKRRPLPNEYGRVIISTPNPSPDFPDVQFDHWLHRAKFTCRLCHVDIGFAMKRNATGIKAEDNIRGYYCGTCHSGKMTHGDRLVFGACTKVYTEAEMISRCKRCHSVGERVAPLYDFQAFTGNLPKERFGNGVNWEKAEEDGLVRPVDFLEGVSFKRRQIEIPKDFELTGKVETMPDIVFSHRKHTKWSGCEGCHPEIFAGVKRGTTKYSMVEIFEGRYCGQCHLNAAFPTTDCQRCHTKPVR
jgi:c(7)-type cytochrome triheme protein